MRGKSEIQEKKREAGGRKHAAAGLACRRVTLSSFWESLMVSKGGGKKCRKGILFSKMNRWRSLSVEICFMSPSHVAAQKMPASVFDFIPFRFLQTLSYRKTDTRDVCANEEWASLCFAFLVVFFSPPPLSFTDTSSCLPFSLKPTLGAETYMPHNYATRLGVVVVGRWCSPPGWLSKRYSWLRNSRRDVQRKSERIREAADHLRSDSRKKNGRGAT